MYRNLVALTNVQGVAAGQVATIDLPTNRRYHTIFLEYSEGGVPAVLADMEAAITKIRILLNSRVQREYSASELIAMNAFNGAPFNFQAGVLPIFFSEPWRRTPGGEDMLAWALEGNGINSFQMEITFAAGRVAPALSGHAEVDYARQPNNQFLPLAPIVTTRARTIQVSGTGDRTLIDMPKDAGDYLRLHCFETAANDITAARVEVDQFTAFNAGAALNVARQINNGFQPQTAVFSIAFDADQRTGDGLPMKKADGSSIAELAMTFTMGVANDFKAVAELVGGAS